MSSSVSSTIADGTATITLDDGKANALRPETLSAIHAALDEAEAAEAVVVLTGRDGIFSAGFDLDIIRAGGEGTASLVRGGMELALRLLSFPAPVVVACSGHAMAMGSFLLLAGDYRLGVADSGHRISANEVAIGMTMPQAAIEICLQRLTPAGYNRAILLADVFTGDGAVAAGFLDTTVPAGSLADAAAERAAAFAGLSRRAHTESKLRLRQAMLDRLAAAIEADDVYLRSLVVR
jgi:enoyl-CoA hydratase